MEWKLSPGITEYRDALEQMQARVAAVQQGKADELVWLLEHPPLYTLGTSASPADVLAHDIPAYETGRGGQVTYHGPGQRVVYLVRDLRKHAAASGKEPDLRAYVADLERWITTTLATFGIEGFTRDGRVGVWVKEHSGFRIRDSGEKNTSPNPESRILNPEKKIAALGVRVQKWVTSHGIALNVNPDLSHYAGIVPCGIREFGVTSMHALGVNVAMDEVDTALKRTFGEIFNSPF